MVWNRLKKIKRSFRKAISEGIAAKILDHADALLRKGERAGDFEAIHEAHFLYDTAPEAYPRSEQSAPWAATQVHRANALQSPGALTGNAAVLRDAVGGVIAAWEVLLTSDAEHTT